MRAGEYTGRASGIPSFAAGKVKRLGDWLAQGGHVSESWFYSDSHNDFPLLGEVDHPVAVDPDETLKQRGRKSRLARDQFAGIAVIAAPPAAGKPESRKRAEMTGPLET